MKAKYKNHEIPRYWFHVPPEKISSKEALKNGLKSYHNRNLDGSTPAIEEAFNQKNPKIIWLSPERIYPRAFVIDILELKEENLKPTYQIEGYFWHLGDIPPEAIKGRMA